jgi:hypothetical protein
MAINRRFLYAGLFLVALGGVVVVADAGQVDSSRSRTPAPVAARLDRDRGGHRAAAQPLRARRRDPRRHDPGPRARRLRGRRARHGLDCGAGRTAETHDAAGPATRLVQVDSNCGSISIGRRPATLAAHELAR